MRHSFRAAAGRHIAVALALVAMAAASSFVATPAAAATTHTEEPMYQIAIEGKGPALNELATAADADVHAQRFVEALTQHGHEISRAEFVVHGRAVELRGRTLPVVAVPSAEALVGVDVAVDSVAVDSTSTVDVEREALRAEVDTLRTQLEDAERTAAQRGKQLEQVEASEARRIEERDAAEAEVAKLTAERDTVLAESEALSRELKALRDAKPAEATRPRRGAPATPAKSEAGG